MLIFHKIKRGASSGFSTTLAANFGIVALNGLSGIMVARLLGPEGRGQFAAAVAWTALLTFVVQLALPQALIYFTARNPEAVGDIFFTTCAIWLVQSVIVVVFGYVLITLVFSNLQPQAMEITRTYVFSIPFTVINTYLRGISQGLKRFRLYNFLRLSGATPYFLSAMIATLFLVNDAYHVIIIMLLLQTILGLSALVAFWKLTRPVGKLRRTISVNLLKYGLKAYWGNLSWMANSRLDQFIMSAFVSLDDLGQYSVAAAYAGFLFPISTAFAIVLFPSVSSTSEAGGRSEIWRAFRLNFLVISFGGLMLGLASPLLVPLLFGHDFTGAINPANVLLVGSVFYGSNYILGDGLRGLGSPLRASIAEIAGTIVTVVGLILFIPIFGMMGAAYVSVLSYATVSLFLLFGMYYSVSSVFRICRMRTNQQAKDVAGK